MDLPEMSSGFDGFESEALLPEETKDTTVTKRRRASRYPLDQHWSAEIWREFLTNSKATLSQIFDALDIKYEMKNGHFKSPNTNIEKLYKDIESLAGKAPETKDALVAAASDIPATFRADIVELLKEYFVTQSMKALPKDNARRR